MGLGEGVNELQAELTALQGQLTAKTTTATQATVDYNAAAADLRTLQEKEQKVRKGDDTQPAGSWQNLGYDRLAHDAEEARLRYEQALVDHDAAYRQYLLAVAQHTEIQEKETFRTAWRDAEIKAAQAEEYYQMLRNDPNSQNLKDTTDIDADGDVDEPLIDAAGQKATLLSPVSTPTQKTI